jgi:uncharacterized membrane protein YcaP (DUF421 family)
MEWLPAGWLDIFALQTPVLALIVRGTVLYVAILLLMRFMLRRASGELDRMDLVFLLLLSEAASTGFGDHHSVTDSLIVVVTLMAWSYGLNALSYHVPLVERLLSPPPLQVVRDGRMLPRRMRREYLTEDELMRRLREEGIDDLAQVKSACVESDGSISVIGAGKEGSGGKGSGQKRKA